ncbi:MAG TPA: pantetheine-phosphate adenylyltransferase, partial [Arachidicoccus soli]|nr:pantetheine-phosphate adenylyltransferase [Arachidicoccus soli]
MSRIALFPGTFDPITLGHVDIVNRSLDLFDKIVIGIGTNVNKQPMYSEAQRIDWIREIYKSDARVEARAYEGLTVNFCKEIGAKYLIRGIRFVSDFEYEKTIA